MDCLSHRDSWRLTLSQGPATSGADAFAGANAKEKASARFGRDDKFWAWASAALGGSTLRTWGAACCAPTNRDTIFRGPRVFLARPESAVVPVDAVAAAGDDAGDDGAGPVGGELAARIP